MQMEKTSATDTTSVINFKLGDTWENMQEVITRLGFLLSAGKITPQKENGTRDWSVPG